jgi:diguanylate cyclase (GGDEF)-like protein
MTFKLIKQDQFKFLFSIDTSFVSLKILFIVFLFLTTSALSSTPNQWLVEEIKVEDGLPDSTVFSLQQDQSGFMWFGTVNGLARFDGYSFKVFKHDGADPATISNNNAGNIFIDSKNVMWIGTFGGGVNTLDLNTGELIRYPYSSSKIDEMVSENVQTFYEGINSNMWIGTATGLYQINGDELTHYDHDETDPNSLIHSRVWNITGDLNGDIWIGTSDGLSQLNPDTGLIQNYKLPEELTIDMSSNQFRKLFITNDYLWIGSSTGLYSFNLKTKIFNTHTSMHIMKINDIRHMKDDQLLIASMEGLFQFDMQNQSFRLDDNGEYWQALQHADIRNIFFDRSGLLWLATRDNGIIKVDQIGGLFQHHTNYLDNDQKNERNKQIWSLEYDSENMLYLGTSETLYKENSENKFDRIITKDSNVIPGIIRDTKHSKGKGIWIGSSEGLFFLNNDSIVAEFITEPFDLVGIKPTDIFSVEESSTGEIWMALYNIGVLRWNPLTSEAELIQSYQGKPLTDINIVHIFQDSSNNIWIGTNLIGVFCYKAEINEFELFAHDFNNSQSISSNRIKDIYQDSKGRLWFATYRGLNLFNKEDKSFKRFHVSDGLLDNSVNTILEDSKQNLWITYKFGISKFNPEKSEFNNYVLNTGMRNDGLNTRSASIDKNDLLHFGSANGYYTFNPNDLDETISFQPNLKLTEVQINNQPIPFGELAKHDLEFDLDHNNRSISFRFSALDFKTSEQIQYSYRTAGLNDDWLITTSTRYIELNNLNPGDYKIEIRAINFDGRWNEQFLKLNLVVHPVWWKLGWVRVIFVLAGLFLGLLFHNYRTYKIRKQNQILESEVKNRTSELLKLNKQLKLASQTDFLTGLYNRSGFINNYKKKRSDKKTCCIVICDVDNFKKINDVYSHSAGDEVLKKITHIMHSIISKEDILARWGGEEFIFFLDDKMAKEAFNLIEKIRTEIENTKIIINDQTIPVTCTFGISQCQPDVSFNDCVNAADEAMYQGKKKGRNITVISDAYG